MYAALDRGLSFKTTMGNVLTLTPPLTITEDEMLRAARHRRRGHRGCAGGDSPLVFGVSNSLRENGAAALQPARGDTPRTARP